MASATYKALQNKAFHQGRYIAYAVAGPTQWTTNGHIMVNVIIDDQELKPLKDQIDMRTNGMRMPDLTEAIDYYNNIEHDVAMVDTMRDEVTATGMKVTRVSGEDGIETVVQSIYIDYVVARFGQLKWYVTERGLLATRFTANIPEAVAVIAKVNVNKENEE